MLQRNFREDTRIIEKEEKKEKLENLKSDERKK